MALGESASASATETPKSLAPNFLMLLSSTNFVPFLRASRHHRRHPPPPQLQLPRSPISFFPTFPLRLHPPPISSPNFFTRWLQKLHFSASSSLCAVNFKASATRQVKTLSAHNFAAVLPGDSVAGLVVANGISNFLNLYNTVLVVRLVLTWFPNFPPAIVAPLSTICDPYLNIFRGLIPPLGGTLDLSPILAFLVLNAFTSTAAAFPAELPASPSSGASQQLTASPTGITNISTSQKKCLTRLQGNNNNTTKSSGGVS